MKESSKKLGPAGWLLLFSGVAAGAFFTNMTYESNYYFLADLHMNAEPVTTNLNLLSYGGYLFWKRGLQIGILAVLLRIFIWEAVVGIFGWILSFSIGVFLTCQLFQEGIQGVYDFLKMLMPQWIFYTGMILIFVKNKQEKQGNIIYITGMILCFLLGFLSEIFLTPKMLGL